ncbi:hypothetical protein ACP70R_005545 [Stipagrostis hirtigluma subsp. patula]
MANRDGARTRAPSERASARALLCAHGQAPSSWGWGAKRPRTERAVPWRDWAGLTAGPAGLIAERVLAGDVADYVRFRAVCTAWRACSTDPRAHGVSDRRFHPRRWIMLPRAFNVRGRRRFLNIHTGERIHHAAIPDLRRCYLLGHTFEGCHNPIDHANQ